ncbi:hypothetical protein [Streptomyces sp. NPDC050560]|uniref:hypothetical protein n=1 Tax=Streptomyces sp. NPDC050560 TaxID=3365630 RepID=UPI00379B3D2A
MSVRPGRVTAVVRERGREAHRSEVLLSPLDDADWDRSLTMAAERAGHVAALLDRDMPPHLVEDAQAVGVDLLPVIGDLEPECGCGCWDHCAHTAALSYRMARLLDRDPFALLLIRGRSEREVRDGLRARTGTRPSAPDGERSGREAAPAGADAYARACELPAPPPPPRLSQRPAAPPPLDDAEDDAGEAARGLDPAALSFVVGRAAAEAHRLLAAALGPGHPDAPPETPLGVGQDAARLAAALPDTAPALGRRAALRLAEGSGRTAGNCRTRRPPGGSGAPPRSTCWRTPRVPRPPWPHARVRRSAPRGTGTSAPRSRRTRTAGPPRTGPPNCGSAGTSGGGPSAGRTGAGRPRAHRSTTRRRHSRGRQRAHNARGGASAAVRRPATGTPGQSRAASRWSIANWSRRSNAMPRSAAASASNSS